MVIFNYKPTSVLNTGLARTINSILLFILIALWSASTLHFGDLDGNYFLMAGFIGFILVYTSISAVLKRNRWFELDKAESKRKEEFIIIYTMLSFLFVSLISITVIFAIECYRGTNQGLWIYLLLILYFVFNWFNICSLFNYGDFIDNLFPHYIDITKLDVKEASKKEKEILRYILEKEYNINIEYLLDCVTEDGWSNYLDRGF